VVACTSNPSNPCNLITGETEGRGSKVPGSSGLQSEFKASLSYIAASTNLKIKFYIFLLSFKKKGHLVNQ
jgi:hypothetical protein